MSGMMPVYLKQRGKDGKKLIAGYLDGKIFRKTVEYSKHHLKTPSGWAIDAEVFDLLPRYGALVIQVLDRETSKLYAVKVATFRENMVPVVIERGCGKQYALADSFWMVGDGRHLRRELQTRA